MCTVAGPLQLLTILHLLTCCCPLQTPIFSAQRMTMTWGQQMCGKSLAGAACGHIHMGADENMEKNN